MERAREYGFDPDYIEYEDFSVSAGGAGKTQSVRESGTDVKFTEHKKQREVH